MRKTRSGAILRTVAAVCGLCAVPGASAPAARAARGDDARLTGCLIRADEGAGYLLTNAPGDPALYKADDHKVAPSAVGTSGGFTTVFYWLYGNNDLNARVGQRVEVEGDFQGDVRDGEIKTHRKDHWTDVEVKSSGQTLKARVPNGSFMWASDHDKQKGGVLVRRVTVDHVKLLAAGC